MYVATYLHLDNLRLSATSFKACYIERGSSLTNESGVPATGSFDSKRHLTTNWNGTIAGTLTYTGDRVNWDNGTYWTRSSAQEMDSVLCAP